MLEPPYEDLTSTLQLADWLELLAITSADWNSSLGDLESVLRIASMAELGDSEAIELKTLEVFNEIELRSTATGEAYPFDLDDKGVLRLRSGWEDYPIYVFCLCLSYFGLSETTLAPRLFEEVSCLAAKGYLHGEAVRFGWPRVGLPSPFQDAVAVLCGLIGEGGGYRRQPSIDRKDDKLDLVAWKGFADGNPSKVLMFGQCAAGRLWEAKSDELNPRKFWNQWMQSSPVSPYPINSFFIPHRVPQDRWDYFARECVLFDRCRIAYWARQVEADVEPYLTWLGDLLKGST